MQKLIALPMARYNNLIEKEKSQSGLNQTVAAVIKNQENEELLQRNRHFEAAHERLPETHNKKIHQHAVTWVPPPPVEKIREYRRKQAKPKKYKAIKKTKAPKQTKKRNPTKKKVVVTPTFSLPLTKKWKL